MCLNIANPENGFAKEEIALGFEPQNASISYSVKAFDKTIIQVEEKDSDKFTISGIKSGETELLIQSDYAPDVNEKIVSYYKALSSGDVDAIALHRAHVTETDLLQNSDLATHHCVETLPSQCGERGFDPWLGN